MLLRQVLTAIAIILVGVVPVRAQVAPVLPPSSQWHLDYAADYCRLARTFGAPGRAAAFYLEQYEPGNEYTVLVVGPDFDLKDFRKVVLRFGPDGGEAGPDDLISTILQPFGQGVMMSSMTMLPDPKAKLASKVRAWRQADEDGTIVPPLQPNLAARISWFEVANHGRVVGRLSLGRMDDPVKALNACTEELMTHWGIDLEKHRTRTRVVTPRTPPSSWISPTDYPSAQLSNGTQGLINFRLGVDETGKPTSCTIQQATQPAGFDKVVCREMLRNARFSPALDAAGKPMASYWRSTVRFAIPR